MYWQQRKKIDRLGLMFDVGLCVLLCMFLLVHLYRYFSPDNSVASIWWSKHQRAAQQWQQKEYLQAARLLSSSPLAAYAAYAGEDFSVASQGFSRQHSASGYFALANSLAHQENYDEAIIAYRMALALKPEWPEAKYNQQLAEVLKDKPRLQRDREQESKSDFSADDISFDLDKQNNDKAVDDALATGDLSENSLRKLWLRQLNRKPVDFLQRKFAYQWQQQKDAAEDSP